MIFEVEDIPNEDTLYLRVHKNYLRDGELTPGVFQAKGGAGMSTDWSRYSTAQQSLARASTPEDNAIARLNVSEVRSIEDLSVKHCPIENNQAHAEVYGVPLKDPFKTRVRAKLILIASLEIRYPR